MSNTLANSAAGNSMWNNDGNALTVQPNVSLGAFAGSASSHDLLNGVQTVASYSQVEITGQQVIRTNNSLQIDPDYLEPIHQVKKVRTLKVATAIRDGLWDEIAGDWSTDPSTSEDFSILFPGGGVDDAANPSYEVPGELTYMDGSKNPINDQYKAKTQ